MNRKNTSTTLVSGVSESKTVCSRRCTKLVSHPRTCGCAPGNLVFYKGRPVGYNKVDNMQSWDNAAFGADISTYQQLESLYMYTLLHKVFSWVEVFRAGIILLHVAENNPTYSTIEMLLVEHKGITGWHPGFWGPPKGIRDAADASALATARREAFEETGVDILSRKYNAKLMTTPFISRRPEDNVREIMIFFVVVFTERPQITPCPVELNDYKWHDVTRMPFQDNISTVTKVLLKAVEAINPLSLLQQSRITLPYID